jgi:hypothetical protein
MTNVWNTRLFAEKMISTGVNTAGMDTPDNGTVFNYIVDPRWFTGAELELAEGRSRMAFGLVCKLDNGRFDASHDIRVYLTFKFDAITGSIQ